MNSSICASTAECVFLTNMGKMDMGQDQKRVAYAWFMCLPSACGKTSLLRCGRKDIKRKAAHKRKRTPRLFWLWYYLLQRFKRLCNSRALNTNRNSSLKWRAPAISVRYDMGNVFIIHFSLCLFLYNCVCVCEREREGERKQNGFSMSSFIKNVSDSVLKTGTITDGRRFQIVIFACHLLW